MKSRRSAKGFATRKERISNSQKWMQLFSIFDRCELDAKITKQLDYDEKIFRKGASLILKTVDYSDFKFLCEYYLSLCTFIEIYAKHLKLFLPDFIVINPPEGRTTFFIVLRTRKACYSEEA